MDNLLLGDETTTAVEHRGLAGGIGTVLAKLGFKARTARRT
jgi:hypothetical protein